MCPSGDDCFNVHCSLFVANKTTWASQNILTSETMSVVTSNPVRQAPVKMSPTVLRVTFTPYEVRLQVKTPDTVPSVPATTVPCRGTRNISLVEGKGVCEGTKAALQIQGYFPGRPWYEVWR